MKTQALSRLQATTVTSGPQSLELPQFRYVNDVQRYLDVIRTELKDLNSLVRVEQQALARLRVPVVLKATAIEINKKVSPGIRKLKSQYNLIQDLYDLYRRVESVESQFSMQFDERQGQAYEGVVATLKALKADISETMRLVFSFLQDVADSRVPSKFKTFMNSVRSAIEHQVPGAETRKTFLYSSVCPEGNLVFTFYMYLVGSSDEDHLYVSVQWIVSSDETYVQVNHEFVVPDELFEIGPGQEVASANSAVKIVLTLLNGEGLATENARGPQPKINISAEDQEVAASLNRALSYF